jgi:hypothetical protein
MQAQSDGHWRRARTPRTPVPPCRPSGYRSRGSAARSVNVTPGRATAIRAHRVGSDQGATPGQKRSIPAAPLRGPGPVRPSRSPFRRGSGRRSRMQRSVSHTSPPTSGGSGPTRRYAAFESRQPRGKPWTDDSPWLIPHLLAVIEGRPHSVLPAPERELSEEEEQAFRRTMAELDRIHDRLVADDPEGCAKALADRERRLAANLRALEREQATREGA